MRHSIQTPWSCIWMPQVITILLNIVIKFICKIDRVQHSKLLQGYPADLIKNVREARICWIIQHFLVHGSRAQHCPCSDSPRSVICSLLNSLAMESATFLILLLLTVLILSVMWSFCYFYGNDISWVVTKHNTKQALTIPAFLHPHGGNSPMLNVCRNGKGDNLKTYIPTNDNRGDEGFSNFNEVDRLNLLAKGRAARDEYVSRSEPVVMLFDMQ